MEDNKTNAQVLEQIKNNYFQGRPITEGVPCEPTSEEIAKQMQDEHQSNTSTKCVKAYLLTKTENTTYTQRTAKRCILRTPPSCLHWITNTPKTTRTNME